MKRLKITDKDALKKWEETRREIMNATTVDSSEPEAGKIKRKAKLEAEPEAWFKYYFPNYCTAEPAAFHKKATRRILQNNRWYEVRAWSREIGRAHV